MLCIIAIVRGKHQQSIGEKPPMTRRGHSHEGELETGNTNQTRTVHEDSKVHLSSGSGGRRSYGSRKHKVKPRHVQYCPCNAGTGNGLLLGWRNDEIRGPTSGVVGVRLIGRQPALIIIAALRQLCFPATLLLAERTFQPCLGPAPQLLARSNALARRRDVAKLAVRHVAAIG